ncbi:GGDEF domain-containing protein [Herbaspirillum sp. AP02]|nr:GGDEF domain-containing protein [Herbaspirillum sp. AP02]NZD69697.1 GGDEF domain-containing protein [Herbaspirillum sp. AP21]
MYRSANQETSKVARLFVVTVCVILVVLESWSLWRERSTALEQASRSTANMAMALSLHAEVTVEEVDIVLRSVLRELANERNMTMHRDRLHELLVENVAALPQLAGLFVYDEKGEWEVNSQPLLETRFNNSGRDYFIYHREHRQAQPFIGKPVQSKSTGHWVLTVSRRVDRPDGSFGGVVLATLDLGFFERLYQQFDIGKKGRILFGANNGVLLYRRPLLANSLGKSLGESTLFQKYIRLSRSDTVEMMSNQDGVLRVNSFQHVAGYPLFIVVGVSKDEILQAWNSHTLRSAIVLMILLALVYCGGIKIVRQVSLREKAQAQTVRAHEDLEKMFHALEAQSQRDGLTGVFNRRYFDAAMDAQAARFARGGGSISLLMIDVDHFKQFNDRYGHVAGDQCLRSVATAIAATARREIDIVARYGGEEFAVLLPFCEESGAAVVANQVCQAVRALCISHVADAGGILTVSVGVVVLQSGQGMQCSAKELVDRADQALYLAKETGRDKVVFYHHPLPERDRDPALTPASP